MTGGSGANRVLGHAAAVIAPRLVRIVLGVLALNALAVGVWATFFPQSFYDDFPGLGRVWVAVDGPYNEHLVRDVGELNLALFVVTVAAVVVLNRGSVLVASAAWLVYSVPHLVYHLRHLDVYDSADQAGVVVSLALAAFVPGLLFWTAWRSPS
jgi:hypothetical protein